MAHTGVVLGQGALDFETAAFQGNTVKSRHASWTGAVHACQARGEKVAALRQLLMHHGPLTLNDCAAILKYPLSSICSLKAAIEDELHVVDFETVAWANGKSTKRARWGVYTRG